MSAASYVGRVGGLAVAFGVGTAVLTGYGVASADSTSSGGESSSSSQGSSGGGGSSDSSGSTSAGESTGSSTGSESSGSGSASDGDGAADEAAAEAAADDAAAEDAAADAAADLAAGPEPGVEVPASSGSDGSVFSTSDEEATDAEVSGAEFDSPSEEGASDDSASDAAAEAIVQDDQSAALEWLASPEVAAGRAPVETSLITQAAVATPVDVESTAVASPVLDVVNNVLNPAG
ncbi:MAG: hypothetical protein ACPHCN_10470, partial [Mycobacterium sp.]